MGLEEGEVLMLGLGNISPIHLCYGMKNVSAASIQEGGMRGKLFQNDRWNQNTYNLKLFLN